MTTQLSILFMALKSRSSDNKELPLYCRITSHSRQKRFMIGCKVPAKIWNQAKQRAAGKSAKADSINQQINILLQKVYKAETELFKRAEPFEVEDIVRHVQGRKNTECRTLMQLYEFRLKQMRKLQGIDYKESTIRKFVQVARTIRSFLNYQYNTEDIPLSKINLLFLKNLETFLKVERRMQLVTLNKVIQRFKSIVNIAVENEWLDRNPFPGHRFKHERLDVVYLTVDELSHLEQFKFAQSRLSRVRDIFLFSVYTGLHYSDAMSLTNENIATGVDGKEWIKYLRQKTGKWIHVPLLHKAKQLMQKFQVENSKSSSCSRNIVPRISNQKINSYLKEVAGICGIEKQLTHKVARKTFGSILLYYNVPMKVVSELMGHSSVTITEKHYAQVELKKLGEAMTSVEALTNN